MNQRIPNDNPFSGYTTPGNEFGAQVYRDDEGRRHRLNSPALIARPHGHRDQWYAYGVKSTAPAKHCQEAAATTTTPEHLARLVTFRDFVVSAVAAHNPNCPDPAKVLWALTRGNTR